MKKILVLAFVMLFALSNAFSNKIIKTSKWECIDLTFKTKDKIDQPFQVNMSCTFTDPDGFKMEVPGFYNGDKEWVVRFNPNKEGVWKAISSSSIQSLDAKKYTIEVSPAIEGVHGGLEISKKNPQKLSYEDGTPYNLLAFEADWLFALDYGNPDLPKTKKMVDAIASNGFNQVIMNVYAYDLSWKQSENIDPKWDYGSRKEIFPFLGDNENPDFSALNIEFFKHYDRIIDLLEENGIIAHIMIYVWNKQVNWPAAESKADDMYFDYVVKRYQAKNNVLWDISKEALGYGHDDPNYITERIERLMGIDVYDRLVTVHDYKYCIEFSDKVDMISAQLWYTDIYSEMLKIKNDYPDKPVLNIEHGGYERCQYQIFTDSNYDSPESCLERNYKCAFAGTYSTYYWQGSSWNIVIYDPFAEDVKMKPKFEYYAFMRKFLDKIGYEKFEPTNKYSSSGYCLANDDDGEYLYYMPKDNSAMAVRRLPKAEKMSIQWFNPLTGKYSGEQVIDFKGWLVLNPEFEGIDNVVIVKLINKIQSE